MSLARRALAPLAASALLCLGLGGCGGGTSSSTPSPAAGAGAPTTSASTASTAAQNTPTTSTTAASTAARPAAGSGSSAATRRKSAAGRTSRAQAAPGPVQAGLPPGAPAPLRYQAALTRMNLECQALPPPLPVANTGGGGPRAAARVAQAFLPRAFALQRLLTLLPGFGTLKGMAAERLTVLQGALGLLLRELQLGATPGGLPSAQPIVQAVGRVNAAATRTGVPMCGMLGG